MPITPTYPGVYIEEIPSGVRTITGVATSITAFVGRAARGPVNEAVTINSYADFSRVFGGLWQESTLGFAVRDFYLNGGSQAIVVRLHNGGMTATVDLPTGAAAPNDFLQLEASNVGLWGSNLQATVDYNTKDPAILFNLVVFEADSVTGDLLGSPETFLNVSIDPSSPRYLPIVLEQQSQLVRVVRDGSGDWVLPNVRPTDTPTGPDVPVLATGGGNGTALTSLTFDNPADPTMRDDKRGLYALEQADLFNLLCIPSYLSTGDVDTSVVTAAAVYCEARRAMLLVDPPSSWTNKATARDEILDAMTEHIGTRSENAALFFPRLRQANPLRENQLEEFVPCGAVAGVFARTDAQRGVWKAPAGLEATLAGVTALSVNLTDAENGELNPLGVNCLRAFPGVGRVIWGARTLQGADRLASEWKYIPVRRLALFLEESLYRGTQWVVFEPNDEPLWSQIRLNIGAFMNNLFRQGAFQGATPRDAYFVKCDRETTTQNDIDRGIVNIVVGFAPLKPTEFVIIKFQQIAGNLAT
ncbi:MAG: phage tail sheath subtilisin-like domain-containing protein [Nodosilinea sp.]